jgi:hypothetical protein
MSTERVSLSDIDGKLRELSGDVKGKVEAKKPPILAGLGALGLLLLILAYFFGKRTGKKKTTFVEIRRV